jgi:hypothetical protein
MRKQETSLLKVLKAAVELMGCFLDLARPLFPENSDMTLGNFSSRDE